MPDVNQYTFRHKELLELMIKKVGVHEGRWRLIVNFGFSAGNFGPSEDQIVPGAIALVNWVGIELVQPEGEAPAALTVDAAEVNPAST